MQSLMTYRLADALKDVVHTDDLTEMIVDGCAEAKAQDIIVLDVSKIFDLSSKFVIVSGRSDRQVQGISNRVAETLNKAGIPFDSRDGYDEGHWILMDYGDVILHIFYEPLRGHYDLESLWREAVKTNVDVRERAKSLAA